MILYVIGQFSMGAKGALAPMVLEALILSILVFHKNIGVSKTMGAGAGGGRLVISTHGAKFLNRPLYVLQLQFSFSESSRNV